MANHVSFYLFWMVSKIQRLLFGLIWHLFLLIYFGIGVGALAVMFLVESQFFGHLTQHAAVGFGIAAIFEVAKVGSSMMKQTMLIANRVTRVKVSALIQAVTVVFQAALLVMSLVCSVVVVTWYVKGAAPDGSVLLGSGFERSSRRETTPQPVVASTLAILKKGLWLEVKAETFQGVFAIVLSVLFQATSYIVFGHLIAIYSREIEHIFEAKVLRATAKKNSGLLT